jgi:hypothetical protein
VLADGDPLTKFATVTALVAALLSGNATRCAAAQPESSGTVVEFENPLAGPLPLQGLLRKTSSAAPSPAVVLLHSCNGNWLRLDERWGKKIASWGYVTLSLPRPEVSGARAIR